MTTPKVPTGYEEYFTGDRGEDCNPTIVDIKEIADRALAEPGKIASIPFIEALKAISALCEATQTDPV